MPRAWTRRQATQQGPQFARIEGLFIFCVPSLADKLPMIAAIARHVARRSGYRHLFIDLSPDVLEVERACHDRNLARPASKCWFALVSTRLPTHHAHPATAVDPLSRCAIVLRC